MPRIKSNKVWDDASSYSGWSQTTGQSGANANGMGRSKSEFAEMKQYLREKIEVPLFGILYAMVKENSFSKFFVVLNLAVELFQLVTFSFKPIFPWSSDDASAVLDFASGGSDSWISYDVFTVLFWLAVGFIVIMIANATHVGYTFMQGHVNSIFLLRTLRWLGSLFVSVLFIPILNILMMGLSCDSRTKKLSQYEDVDCWGTKNVAIAIIGIIMAIAFSVIAFLTCLTYYEYDYSIPKGYSRLQNRFELIVLIIKTAMVLVSSFVLNRTALGVIFLFCSSLLFVGSLVLMPVYNLNVNRARTGIYAAVLWTNISLMIALVVNDHDNSIPIVIFGIGFIPAALLGVLALNFRFKYLCNPDLIMTNNDPDAFPIPGSSSVAARNNRKVQWEESNAHAKNNHKFINSKMYSRLVLPTDVEIAARFALTDKPSSATTEKAKAIYAMGMAKFPKSATVLQAYVNFIFTVLGDWQLGYSTLEKLRTMSPALDIRFFIYRYDKDREQKIETGGTVRFGDFVNFMEFKKLHRSAKRFHIEAIRSRRAFWRLLLNKSVDANELSQLSAKIATSETKASEHYDQLLSRYPHNVRGLRDYARFVDEILNDTKTAQKIWAKADKLEEIETAKATNSYREEMTRGNSTLLPGAGVEETTPAEHPDGSSNGLSDPTSHDDFSDTTSHNDVTSDSSKSSGFTRSLDQAHAAKTTDLKRLSWIMFFTTCAAVIICVVQISVLSSQLNLYTKVLEQLEGANSVGYQASQLTCALLDAVYLANVSVQEGNNDMISASGSDYDDAVSRGFKLAHQLGNIAKALYWGASTYDYFMSPRFLELKRLHGMKVSGDASKYEMSYSEFSHNGVKKSVKHFMEEPKYHAIDYTSDPNYVSYVYGSYNASVSPTSFWRLTMSFTQQALIIFGLGEYVLGNATAMLPYASSFNFLLANPGVYLDGSVHLAETLNDEVLKSNDLLVIVAGILLAIAVIALILVAATLFRIVVNNIFDHKMRTLHLFAMIPRRVVRIMLKKKFKQLGQADTTEDETDKPAEINEDEKKEMLRKEKKLQKKAKKYIKRPGTPKLGAAAGEDSDAPAHGDDETIHVGPIPGNVNDGASRLPDASDDVADFQKGEKEKRVEVEYAMGGAVIDIPPTEISSSSNVLIPLLPLSKENKEGKQEKKSSRNHNKSTEQVEVEKQSSGSESAKSKKKSRIDTKSINKVVTKLHISYIIAIALFIICFAVSFVIEWNSFVSMSSVSKHVQNAALRTQYMRAILYDVTLYAYYPAGHPLSMQVAVEGDEKLVQFYNVHQNIPIPENQMSLFFDSTCLRINQSDCLANNSKYYDYTSHGLDFLVDQWYSLAKSILSEDTIWTTDSRYVALRWLGENDLFDGLVTSLFLFSVDGRKTVDKSITALAIVISVDVVAFIFIHVFVFKRFVRELQAENEHTFSIIRMIPRHMLNMIGEIQDLVNTTDKEDA